MEDETLAELQRLSDAATPGPWHVEESEWDIPGSTEVDRIVCGPNPRGVPREGIADVFDGHWVRGEEDPGPAPNLYFIVAARNALPSLLRELADTRAENEDLQGDLNDEVVSHERTKKRLEETRARLAAARERNQAAWDEIRRLHAALGATDQAGGGE